jgi:hypothetical protein
MSRLWSSGKSKSIEISGCAATLCGVVSSRPNPARQTAVSDMKPATERPYLTKPRTFTKFWTRNHGGSSMKVSNFRSMVAALILAFVSAGAVMARIPAGWIIDGSAPNDYEFSRDETTSAGGKFSASIDAKFGANGFGTLMQMIDADNYRGGRWKLTGYLKTDDAIRAQMFMRVDGPDRKVVSFDNMDSRPIIGTSGWTRYEIVLDVPADSVDIAFGFLLAEGGTVWGDNFSLEKVDPTVPVTSTTAAGSIKPKEPVNTDFES